MTEVTPAPVATTPVTDAPATPPAAPATPPWGEDFDAEKAWNLVQNLRADKDKLTARPVLTPEQQKQLGEYNALVEASKSDAQRLQDAATAAQTEAATAKADALRLRMAIEHGIGADDLDLLGSGTQEEIEARAKRIAELRAAATPAAVPPPTPVPGQRPVEQLRPGATPSGAQSEDQANYERLFGPGSWAKTQ